MLLCLHHNNKSVSEAEESLKLGRFSAKYFEDFLRKFYNILDKIVRNHLDICTFLKKTFIHCWENFSNCCLYDNFMMKICQFPLKIFVSTKIFQEFAIFKEFLNQQRFFVFIFGPFAIFIATLQQILKLVNLYNPENHSDIREEDAGTYLVTAENSIGRSSQSFRVNVEYPPR